MTRSELDTGRRRFMGSGIALAGTLVAGRAMADWAPSLRYPDPSVEILNDAFARYRVFNSTVERIATGFSWLEGPVWIGDGRYLLLSDIPGDRLIRWDEITGETAVFRNPAGWSNGNARDLQGRLVTCEGGMRRVTRTEIDGSITVLADSHDGKPLNSPNDLCVGTDGSIWFTDPPFQITNDFEGRKAAQEQPHQGVYRIAPDGSLSLVAADLQGPNGIGFSPDFKTLYVVEGRAKPDRLLWGYDVADDGTLSNKRKVIVATGAGALDGIAVDVDGNIWCGWGSSGGPGGNSELQDGVRIFTPAGEAIGHIHLPERCANLCFGGARGNRLFMASSHSIYSVYVNTRGASPV